jgi:hypothetical protein
VRPVQLLFDEHVSKALGKGLRRLSPGADLLRVGEPDAPACGTSDADLLLWCEANRRLLVSRDRSTMPDFFARHLSAGHQSWGVLLLRPEMSLQESIHELALVTGASWAEEWLDRISYLPLQA